MPAVAANASSGRRLHGFSGKTQRSLSWCTLETTLLRPRWQYCPKSRCVRSALPANAQERFSIVISPDTLEFIPLPSRHLISDTYWSRFTLLGQSLGSLYVAWEGLCGKNGMWGDIFIGKLPEVQ